MFNIVCALSAIVALVIQTPPTFPLTSDSRLLIILIVTGIWVGLLPSLAGKLEREKNKPRFEVNIVKGYPVTALHIIRVELSPHNIKEAEARFCFVSVRNVGIETAEGVIPHLWLRGLAQGFFHLIMIPLGSLESILVKWRQSEEEFNASSEHGFALALIWDEVARKETMSLYGGGIGQGFLLFFTVKGSNILYFPSEAPLRLEMPCKLVAGLFFEVKDLPKYLAKMYEVDASSWDSFQVQEIPGKDVQKLEPNLHIGYLP
jgi:hypothetical protein